MENLMRLIRPHYTKSWRNDIGRCPWAKFKTELGLTGLGVFRGVRIIQLEGNIKCFLI